MIGMVDKANPILAPSSSVALTVDVTMITSFLLFSTFLHLDTNMNRKSELFSLKPRFSLQLI